MFINKVLILSMNYIIEILILLFFLIYILRISKLFNVSYKVLYSLISVSFVSISFFNYSAKDNVITLSICNLIMFSFLSRIVRSYFYVSSFNFVLVKLLYNMGLLNAIYNKDLLDKRPSLISCNKKVG